MLICVSACGYRFVMMVGSCGVLRPNEMINLQFSSLKCVKLKNLGKCELDGIQFSLPKAKTATVRALLCLGTHTCHAC